MNRRVDAGSWQVSRVQRSKSRAKKSLLTRFAGILLRPFIYFAASWFVVPVQVVSDIYKNRDDDRKWGMTVLSATLLATILAFAISIGHAQINLIEANFPTRLPANLFSNWFEHFNLSHVYILAVLLCLPRLWNFLFRPIVNIFVVVPITNLTGDEFYRSHAWRNLRYDVLRTRGAVCELCGSEETPLHVDHVKPRSKYPALALDKANLQVLCADCNIGKGARYEDDFRAS